MSAHSLKRYAAKLLFVHEVVGESGSQWACESRIVVGRATCAHEALERFKQQGASLQWEGTNENNRRVVGVFKGVQELLCLDDVAEDESEVWYEVFTCASPEAVVPQESHLNAIALHE